jgi:hypothetical protein
LKLSSPVQGTVICAALSLNQILGRAPLKQSRSLDTDGARVRMASEVFDHGTRAREFCEF